MSDNSWSVVHSRKKGKLFSANQRRRQSNLAARRSSDVHKRTHDFLSKVNVKIKKKPISKGTSLITLITCYISNKNNPTQPLKEEELKTLNG